MNSKLRSLINKKLGFLINNKEIIDLIIIGSAIKGKALPRDIDIAVIVYKELSKELKKRLDEMPNFHISILTVKDFFINPPSLVATLFREGYSIKNKKFFAENFRFLNRVLFKYNLAPLPASIKVKIVNILRGKDKGKGKEMGLVEKNEGEWIANQVFIVPIQTDKLIEEFFNNFKVNYKKFYVLIH